MIETIFNFSVEDKTTVERIIAQQGLRINHLSLAKGDSIDPHTTNEAAYMIVTKGILALTLNDQEQKRYPEGTIIKIPANTLLGIANKGSGTMHLFVIKTE